ncbi:MAG: 6-carboxytetrahydropterin synthase QueD [Oribacterium sp.]|nr:6-carboxytetrahydropterin synthase QueD [Oribacterium sp.]
MFFLKSESSFDAAHFLKGYEGKCSNIHGHRWRVVVEIEGEKLSEEAQTRGMLVDFSDLKKAIKELCDKFDHTFIYEEGSLKDATVKALMEEDFKMNVVAFRPTAENFAKFFYESLATSGFVVHRVEVYETPNNCACYEG